MEKKRCNLSTEHVEALAKIHGYYVSNCKEELKIVGENISENEILDTFLAAQDDNEDDDDIEESSLEEENNDINANEGLYILIIQNTMDLSHSDFQDLDDDDENRNNDDDTTNGNSICFRAVLLALRLQDYYKSIL